VKWVLAFGDMTLEGELPVVVMILTIRLGWSVMTGQLDILGSSLDLNS